MITYRQQFCLKSYKFSEKKRELCQCKLILCDNIHQICYSLLIHLIKCNVLQNYFAKHFGIHTVCLLVWFGLVGWALSY